MTKTGCAGPGTGGSVLSRGCSGSAHQRMSPGAGMNSIGDGLAPGRGEAPSPSTTSFKGRKARGDLGALRSTRVRNACLSVTGSGLGKRLPTRRNEPHSRPPSGRWEKMPAFEDHFDAVCQDAAVSQDDSKGMTSDSQLGGACSTSVVLLSTRCSSFIVPTRTLGKVRCSAGGSQKMPGSALMAHGVAKATLKLGGG
jgi:hypothetical protein